MENLKKIKIVHIELDIEGESYEHFVDKFQKCESNAEALDYLSLLITHLKASNKDLTNIRLASGYCLVPDEAYKNPK